MHRFVASFSAASVSLFRLFFPHGVLRKLRSSRSPRACFYLAGLLFLANTAHAQAPVAAYAFDESSGTTIVDTSGNNHTLTLANGATRTTGRYAGGISFDGSNDAAIANSASSALNLAGRSLTLSAWIYPRSNSGWQMIVNKPATAGHSPPFFDWSLHRENGTGRIVAFFGCESVQRTSSSTTPLNTWTHVAVTYDGSSLRHYINGVLDRTTSVTCSIANAGSRPIRVGANGASGEVMNGIIDDVRIYNRVLSAGEIQNDMSTPLSGGGGAPGDTTAPTVTITSPTYGSSVAGTINVNANAADNIGVVGVQFQLNGTNLGSEDVSAPYSVGWNTQQYTNGSHTLTAIARDAAGNRRTSSSITVSVNNAAGTPSLSLSASPSTIDSGQTSTLGWNSSNVTSCTASNGWSGSKPTNGSQVVGPLSSNRTYSLNCTGPGGSISRSTTVTVNAVVPAPTLTLSASPSSVPSGGSATLTWNSTNASSCTASGAWSGSKPTSGSASTGSLTNATNDFTLNCTGTGGSISRTARVTLQSESGTIYGLDFPGSAATTNTVRFRFRNPLRIYPATYIWRVKPRHQLGYYTTFFWANDGAFNWGGHYGADTFYGAHPYPTGGGSTTSTHRWEIAAIARDYVSQESVEYDRWHTQALRVWADSNGKHHEFYWDLPNTSRVIRVDLPREYGEIYPPNPALTWGDAPWAPSEEIMNGVIRGIQIYSATLSLQDILAEVSNPRSTNAGSSNIWYLNLNPTPSDISDKSGAGHHPEWVGPERARLWVGP